MVHEPPLLHLGVQDPFQFLCGLIVRRSVLVISHAIIEDQVHVIHEVNGLMVSVIDTLLLYGQKRNGMGDDWPIVFICLSQGFWGQIHHERGGISVIIKQVQDIPTLLLPDFLERVVVKIIKFFLNFHVLVIAIILMLLVQLVLLVPLIPRDSGIVTILILNNVIVMSPVIIIVLLINGPLVDIHLLLIITTIVIFPLISTIVVCVIIIWDWPVHLWVSTSVSLALVAVVLITVTTFSFVDLPWSPVFFLIAGYFQVNIWSVGCSTSFLRVVYQYLALILTQTDSDLIIGTTLPVFIAWNTIYINNILIFASTYCNYVFIILIVWWFLRYLRIYSGVFIIKANEADTIHIILRECLIWTHASHLCKKIILIHQRSWILHLKLRIGLHSRIHHRERSINRRLKGIAK